MTEPLYSAQATEEVVETSMLRPFCCSHCASTERLRPPGPPEKRLRRACRPVSSSPSDSARQMTPNPPGEAFWGGI
eukprot:354319-Alexandrium_andersonii.AAC.1